MAVLQMQRISICALKHDRKAILEKLQSMGMIEMHQVAQDEAGFEKMDTQSAKSSFEKRVQITENALDVLNQYTPEKKSMFASLEGNELIDKKTMEAAAAKQEAVMGVAGLLIADHKKIAEAQAEIVKRNTQIEALTPWMSLEVAMNYPGTKKTAMLLGTMAAETTLEMIYGKLAEDHPEIEAVDISVISQDKDAIRWYFYVNSAPWLPNRFHGKAVVEGQRKFMGTLWNTYAFFVLYANIDDFDATKYTLDYDKLSVMDKWLLSKLNSAIKAVDYDLSNYKIPEAAKALQSFVDDMSNWYVRRSRERFWAKGMEQDKINAYMTLYTALVEICKTAAPMIPFMTEEIYQNLVRSVDESAPESIHLCDFPVVNEAHIDTELEANMDNVLKLVVMGRACRNTANIKNRQPIGQMYVKADFEVPEFYKDIVKDELNVKNVTFTQDVRDFTSYTFKPQLKTVGPKYGKMLGGIKAALDNLEGNAAMDELNATDALKLDINGQEVTLFREDLLIESAQMPGYVSENDNGITVVMDTNLSEELLEEGFVREIISKVQTMRKEAGFEVMDKIAVTYEGTEKAEKVFADNASTIADETLALEVTKAALAGYTKEWKINGEAVTIGVEKR